MEHCKVDFRAIPWEAHAPGVRSKSFHRGGRQLRLVEFAKDFLERDWCLGAHIGYVLEGRGEIDFHGQLVSFAPGDGIFIPAGEDCRHKLTVLSDFMRIVLVEDV